MISWNDKSVCPVVKCGCDAHVVLQHTILLLKWEISRSKCKCKCSLLWMRLGLWCWGQDNYMPDILTDNWNGGTRWSTRNKTQWHLEFETKSGLKVPVYSDKDGVIICQCFFFPVSLCYTLSNLDISHQTAAVQHAHISYCFIQTKHLLDMHYHVMLSKVLSSCVDLQHCSLHYYEFVIARCRTPVIM